MSRSRSAAGTAGMFLAALLVPVICCANAQFTPTGSSTCITPPATTCSLTTRTCRAQELQPAMQLCGPEPGLLPGVTESARKSAGVSTESAATAMVLRPLRVVELIPVTPRFCNPVGTVQLRI